MSTPPNSLSIEQFNSLPSVDETLPLDVFSSLPAAPAAPQSSAFVGPMTAFSQGATLGFADEGAAKMRSFLGETFPNLFPQFAGISEEEQLSAIRGGMKDYKEAHPYMSAGLEIAGGVAPMLLAPASKAAQVPSLARQIVTGTTLGGVTAGTMAAGQAEGDLATRIEAAKTPGVVGAAFGAAAPIVANTIGAGYRAFQGMPQRASNPEAGAVSLIGLEQQAPTMDAANRIIARRLVGTPINTIEQTKDRLTQALTEGAPLLPSDELTASTLPDLVDALARRRETSDIVRSAIDDRMEGQTSRLVSALMTEQSPYVAGEGVKKAAEGVQKKITQELGRKYAPLYDEAFTRSPTVEPDDLIPWLDTKNVSLALKDAQRATPELAALDVDSSKVLNRALSSLKSELRDFKTPNKEKAALAEAVDALDGILPESVKNVNKKYAKDVQKRTAAFGGVLDELATLEPDQFAKAGKRLLDLQPEQVTNLLNQMGPEAKPALSATIKGYFENLLTDGKTAFVKSVLKSDRQKGNLEKILGAKETERLVRFMEREQRISRGSSYVTGNSRTAGRMGQDELLTSELTGGVKKGVGALANALLHPVSTLDRSTNRLVDVLLGDANYETTLPVARRLMDTRQSVDALDAIIPYLRRVEPIYRKANSAGKFGGYSSGIATGGYASKD